MGTIIQSDSEYGYRRFDFNEVKVCLLVLLSLTKQCHGAPYFDISGKTKIPYLPFGPLHIRFVQIHCWHRFVRSLVRLSFCLFVLSTEYEMDDIIGSLRYVKQMLQNYGKIDLFVFVHAYVVRTYYKFPTIYRLIYSMSWYESCHFPFRFIAI